MQNDIRRGAEKLLPLTLSTLVLVLWETGSRRAWWNSSLLPGPSEVARTLANAMYHGSLLLAIRISLVRLMIGFGTALLLGTLLGVLNGTVPLVRRTVGPLALGVQTLPSICWLPLAIVWFGRGERAILFVTLMGALMAITLAVSDGIRNIPTLYLQTAGMMGIRGPSLYVQVLLPAAFPALLSGARQGWAFAWRALMAGELLAVSSSAPGLGQTLMRGRDLHDMSLVVGIMCVLIGLGLAADRLLFTRLENSVNRRWGVLSS